MTSLSFRTLTKHINWLGKLGNPQTKASASSGTKRKTHSFDKPEEVELSEDEVERSQTPDDQPIITKTPHTPKKRGRPAKVTSTLITPARTPTPPADAASSEDSELSDGPDDAFFSCATSRKPTGPTGSSITCKKDGASFLWEAKGSTSAAKFIDIKIYDDPKALKGVDPMEVWRHANFRAKVMVGSPIQPAKGQRVLLAVKELQNAILEDFKNKHPKVNPIQTSAGKGK
uniref:NS2 protein n=1 Tax=Tarsiger cyanurus ambidensovirus TaxID=2794449 RepID=A0A8E7G1Y5_9VIRU|nr:MAG: putative NS2 protein [Tarsiger cyanurus ambidensovirus]